MTENLYNDLGQLWQKKLHNGQQTTAYAYTPRGWLKSLSSGEFSEQLKYEDGSLAQYNGNISGQLWGSGSNLSQSFSYSYDALNRLVTASSPGLGESISYDGMGNILSLSRDGYGTNTYSNYNGNRLGSISGFVTGSYGYDANGNMTSAPGGLSMSYNNMNLPSVVSKGGVQSNYTYDYAGRKLRRSGGGSATRDYVDGIEYAGGSIDFIQTEEGIARRSGSTYNYEYSLKDHLGNTRYSFDIWNGGIRRIQQQDYYAFGLAKNVYISGTKNNYLYNGKELQEQTGQYDYGARFYDPVIARWMSVDPLAEKMFNWTPYRYGLDNPVRMFDSDGRIEIDPKVAKQYPGLVSYAKNLASTYANKPEAFRNTFKQYSRMTDSEIKSFVTYGKGPRVTVTDLDKSPNKQTNGETVMYMEGNSLVNSDENGKYVKGGGRGLIRLDNDVVSAYENAGTMGGKNAGELLLESTIFHEAVHVGTGKRHTQQRGSYQTNNEEGKEFEKAAYGEDVGRTNSKRIVAPELKAVSPKRNYNQ